MPKKIYSEGRTWICKKERQSRFDKGTTRHASGKVQPGQDVSGTVGSDGRTSEAESGTENGKNSYKGLWQLHVGK